MKKSLLYVLSLTLCVLFSLGIMFACKDKEETDGDIGLSALSKPIALRADFWEFSWGDVENATGYTVKLLGEEYTTQETSFQLFEFIDPGDEVVLELKAIGDGITYCDSEWAKTIYKAQNVTQGLDYKLLNDGTYSVYCAIENIPLNGELVLPDMYKNKTVTVFQPKRILNGRYEYKKVTKVRLPKYVTKIEGSALYKSQIQSIYLPSSLKEVGGFSDCEKLAEIKLPEGVTKIGGSTFKNCKELKEIQLPETLTEIGGYAFANTGISTINLPKNVYIIDRNVFDGTPWYEKQKDGLVYCGHVLYGYKGKMPENTELCDILPSVKVLTQSCFMGQENLMKIVLPNDIKEIPTNAFNDCKNLKSIVLPDCLKEIGGFAFSDCINLKDIDIPDTVRVINSGAFYKSGITSINIPEGVEVLYGKMLTTFESCQNLERVILPSTLKEIQPFTFLKCSKLKTVVFGEGIREINADGVFWECSSLTEVFFPDSVESLSFGLFQGTGVKHIELPKKLAIIKGELDKDSLVESITIPKTLTELDYNDFYLAKNLQKLYYQGTQADWERLTKNITYAPSSSETQDEIKEKQAALDAWVKALTVYFYSENEPTEEGNYWHYDENGKPAVW